MSKSDRSGASLLLFVRYNKEDRVRVFLTEKRNARDNFDSIMSTSDASGASPFSSLRYKDE